MSVSGCTLRDFQTTVRTSLNAKYLIQIMVLQVGTFDFFQNLVSMSAFTLNEVQLFCKYLVSKLSQDISGGKKISCFTLNVLT